MATQIVNASGEPFVGTAGGTLSFTFALNLDGALTTDNLDAATLTARLVTQRSKRQVLAAKTLTVISNVLKTVRLDITAAESLPFPAEMLETDVKGDLGSGVVHPYGPAQFKMRKAHTP